LTGRDGDPGRSREHALLCVLGERRLRARKSATLEELLPEILEPPVAQFGALDVDAFMSRSNAALSLPT